MARESRFQKAGRIGGLASAAKSMAAVEEYYRALARASGTLRAVGERYGVSHEIVRRARKRFPPEESAA